MHSADGPEKILSDEVARLALELEQARVALEDAHAETAAVAEERDRLLRHADALSRARVAAEEETSRIRAQAAKTTGLVASALQQVDPHEDLKVALEETSVLAEELQATNEELLTANEELDQRVAERTAALDLANAKLERINTDLHRRVEIETAARTKAQVDLFRLQKLEAIGQLTGGIAHDFNNLLTVITSGLQLIRHPRDQEHKDRVLRHIEEAAWRGARLTQRLLAFARRQPLHPERLELSALMETMRELLAHALRDNITMRVSVDPGIWPVEVDAAALELAMLNLAVNARDAMPAGGTLLLSASNSPIRDTRADGFELGAGDYIEISVTDTGTGMTAEVLERVFEPFFSTKTDGKGTGLGLAQVYGFARQSGGTAWIESTPGRGTAVHILLPRSHRPEARAMPSAVAASAHAPRNEHLNVLVVEDDEGVAAMVLDMLHQLGHRGRRVTTMASALAALSGPERTDLVFSDVLLQGEGTGLDLAREIAARRIDVPLILTSGFGGGMTQRLAAANLPFLRKPYRIEALQQAIDGTIPVHQPVAPAVAVVQR